MTTGDATPTGLADTGERMMPAESDRATFWEHIYRYRFARRYVRDRRVLDIASGEGYGVAGLLRSGAKSVIGVDISAEAIEHATRRYGNYFMLGGATHIPLENQSRDVIVSFETIEHLNDPAAFLQECARVLVPGGTLLLSTPNDLASRHRNPFHVRELSLAAVRSLLAPFFSCMRYYDQTMVRAPVWSLRSIAARESPWLRMPGGWRLATLFRSRFCPHVFLEDARERYGRAPVDAIVDTFRDSEIFNPYVVRRHKAKDGYLPLYMLIVATRR